MAEQVPELVQEIESTPRGGDFLFNPVGSRPFMTPERFSEEQRQFFATGTGFLQSDVFPAIGRIEAKDNALLRQLLGKAGDLGLTAVKFGWGPFGRDEAVDLAPVEAARRAVGEDRDLMVDAGQCWDAATALDRAQRLEPYSIAWLEEPLSQDDLAGYAEFCPQSPVPIAAGEGGVTRWDFEDLQQKICLCATKLPCSQA